MVLLESLKIKMGEPVKNFQLKGIDIEAGKLAEKFYTLADFAEAEILVIVFMCNHCPYVQAVWPRLVDLQNRFQKAHVQFVGINANANPKYEEDSFEKMKGYFQKYNMNFPYLIDEDQNVAREYSAQCTPDIFVYDSERKLSYHGRIDDNWKDKNNVTREELAEALELLLKGEKPDEADQYPCMGCSIKWRV